MDDRQRSEHRRLMASSHRARKEAEALIAGAKAAIARAKALVERQPGLRTKVPRENLKSSI
jgi:hypothetical protein